jgi:adenylate cyclase
MERKLAAILAADVAGYSRLMAEDEEATLATLRAWRVITDDLICKNGGRVFGGAGDSLVAEFPSVLRAACCAVEIQRKLDDHNQAFPESRRMHFRIGINLGDVMVAATDLFGDGVNIAARVSAIAEPGGVCISGSVFDQIEGKNDFVTHALGEQTLKNIPKQVRVYRLKIRPTDDHVNDAKSVQSSEKPSIVVFPFANLSGDSEQAYFSDGITEDIITDLSKISGLFVIARNSAFAYKEKPIKLQEVTRALGVRYVLQGSVRKVGNRVRITTQLTDCISGGHLWAERYDRDLLDIFAVQDEVTQEIVAALAINLTGSESRRLKHTGTDNPEAYEYYVRGRQRAWKHYREANEQARRMLRQALELDPSFAAAHASLAYTHQLDYVNRWCESPEKSLNSLYELAQKAVALDREDPDARFVLGLAYLWRKELDNALTEAQRALRLHPNFANAYALLALVLHYAGRSKEAFEPLARGMRLDPHYTDMFLHILGQAHFGLGQYHDAIAALKRRIIRNPNTDASRILLAAAYGHVGLFEEARTQWDEAHKINPDYSLDHRRKILPYKESADFERIVEGLRKVGLPPQSTT